MESIEEMDRMRRQERCENIVGGISMAAFVIGLTVALFLIVRHAVQDSNARDDRVARLLDKMEDAATADEAEKYRIILEEVRRTDPWNERERRAEATK